MKPIMCLGPEKIKDESVCWPFRTKEADSRLQFYIPATGRYRKPENVISIILKQKVKEASEYLGKMISNVVLTVPASVTKEQKLRYFDIAKEGNMNIRLIEESTAVAIAHYKNARRDPPQTILVVNFGAGFLDVSVLTRENQTYRVLAAAGIQHQAGREIDRCLVDYMANEYRKMRGVDIRQNPRAMERMRKACEKAKKVLSSGPVVNLQVDNLINTEDFNSKLTINK